MEVNALNLLLSDYFQIFFLKLGTTTSLSTFQQPSCRCWLHQGSTTR